VTLHWDSPRQPGDFAPGTTGQPNACDWLLDCRGLGAQPQWPQVRGVRGEVALLHAPNVRLSRPTRLIHPRYPIYIAPKEDGLFKIGATEIESDDMSPNPTATTPAHRPTAAWSARGHRGRPAPSQMTACQWRRCRHA